MSFDVPGYFDDNGKRIWRETLEQLMAAGTHSRVDPNSLTAYVGAIQRQARLNEILARSGMLNEKGRPNPILGELRKEAQIIEKFAKQFRLNQTQPIETASPVQQLGRYCPTHKKHECIGLTIRKALCHNSPVIGRDRCKKHCGVKLDEDPVHLLAVERRKNPLDREPLDVGPADGLLKRVQLYAAELEGLDELIHALERDELVWGKTQETHGPDGTTAKYESRLSVWIIARSHIERAYQSACTACLNAGIEERLVRLAEVQAQTMYRVMTTGFARMGIAADDPRIPEVMPALIRELTG